MIQRIQTLWFLIASLAAFLTLKFSFYSGVSLNDRSFHELNGVDNSLLMFSTILLGGLSFINIFLYKKRPLQIKLAIAGLLVEIGILFLYVKELKIFADGNYDIWSFLHIIIIISLILGIRGVYKDQKLIRESNRLR